MKTTRKGPPRKYLDGKDAAARCAELWNRGYFNVKNVCKYLSDVIPGRQERSGLFPFGCYTDDFVWHIERQFIPFRIETEFMTWSNKIMWHFDHIMPVSSFDRHNPESMRECWHWTNFRPLWEDDNRKKGKKITVTMRYPFSERQFWLPRQTIIGSDGLAEIIGDQP